MSGILRLMPALVLLLANRDMTNGAAEAVLLASLLIAHARLVLDALERA